MSELEAEEQVWWRGGGNGWRAPCCAVGVHVPANTLNDALTQIVARRSLVGQSLESNDRRLLGGAKRASMRTSLCSSIAQ